MLGSCFLGAVVVVVDDSDAKAFFMGVSVIGDIAISLSFSKISVVTSSSPEKKSIRFVLYSFTFSFSCLLSQW